MHINLRIIDEKDRHKINNLNVPLEIYGDFHKPLKARFIPTFVKE